MAVTIDGTDGISPLKASGQTQTTTGTAAAPAISSSSDTDSGIFFGSNEVNISTGGTQRATVDSSGNVGIGNTNPSDYASGAENLVVGDTSSANGMTILSGTSNAGGINFADGTSGTDRGRIDYDHGDDRMRFYTAAAQGVLIDSGGHTHFGVRTGNNNASQFSSSIVNICGPGTIPTSFSKAACYLHIGNTESTANGLYPIGFGFSTSDRTHLPAYIAYITEDSGGAEHGPLVFATRNVTTDTAPTERMRIGSDGRIGVANTLSGTQDLSGSRLSVYGNASAATGSIPLAVHTANVGSERYMIVFFNGNGNVGNIRTNGSSTSYNTSSDYRLKENVVGITDGITRVKQLQPKRFNFIADADTTVDGFLAHEAQAVVPEAISGTHNQVQVWDESEELPDGVSVGDNKLDENGNTIPEYQSIDQSKLVPLLTAALQEAIGKIETLETQNADLLARVTALEAAE